MKDTGDANAGRMILDPVLSDQDAEQVWGRTFKQEFATGRKSGSIYRFAFLAHQRLGEKRLKQVGKLELFQKTQRLPDYARAEDAIKRGWGRWVELEYGVRPDEAGDNLKIRQFLLLSQLRVTRSTVERQKILRGASGICRASAEHGDDGFFRRLGRVLDDPPRMEDNTNDFTQVLLHHWLTSFWWLMPLKAVAADIAGLQGRANDIRTIRKFNDRLRQVKSRRVPGRTGAFYSTGWSGCFYTTHPPLINSIEGDGRPLFSPAGRRLLM